MHPRVVCNVVYARLVSEASQEDREKFNEELYAPTGDVIDVAGRIDALANE